MSEWDVNSNYKALLSVSDKWDSIPLDEQIIYRNTLRRQLNEYVRRVFAQVDTIPKEYVLQYNKLVDRFKSKVPFTIQKLTGSPEKFTQTINSIKSNMQRGASSYYKSVLQKQEFFNKALNSINQDNVDLFRPRITLLDVASSRQIQVKNDIIKLISSGFEEGLNKNKITRGILNRLKESYPSGSIIYSDKNGRSRSMNLETYTNMWNNDIATIVNNRSTLGYMKQAKADLIEIKGGFTDNPVCDPYSSPPGRRPVYSISGLNPNYPKLTSFPPYHPNCSKYTIVAPENFTKENMAINEEIYGQGKKTQNIFNSAIKKAS